MRLRLGLSLWPMLPVDLELSIYLSRRYAYGLSTWLPKIVVGGLMGPSVVFSRKRSQAVNLSETESGCVYRTRGRCGSN